MATSFGTVKRHQGEFRCDSTLGKGAAFSVVLPVVSSDAVVREETWPRAEAASGDATTMIVDDGCVVRTVASNVLTGAGVPNHRSRGRHFGTRDLVLLDVTVPGMSGQEVHRESKRLYPALRELMCSGYDLKGDGEMPFDSFVSKSFSAATLFKAIRWVLE